MNPRKGLLIMNLKESFRYQNFLDVIERSAISELVQRDHCLRRTMHHHMNAVNPDVEDKIEVDDLEDYPGNDKVIRFFVDLINEKQGITDAIGKAKQSIPFDIDSAVATNKFRQAIANSISVMISHRPSKSIERGSAYKFNVEGNQIPYYYDIDVTTEDAYDRALAKEIMRQYNSEADKVSSEIDAAMINTIVDFTPKWDMNDTFEEILVQYS